MLILTSLALAAAAPAFAQEGHAQPPQRESQIDVFGNDPCPQSTDDEIVVCHRRSEEERYRIPAPLRHSRDRVEQGWGARAQTMDEVSRDVLPNSCSTIGSYGQSGCQQAFIQQWYNSRRASRAGP
ncbi:MAG: hypothetical protein JO276_14640 [Sphingomonadaceae bacterium]|nr:hypothetical protein [Sphingomonadaceae bacterium]